MPMAINHSRKQTKKENSATNSTSPGNRAETAFLGKSRPKPSRSMPKQKYRRSPNLTLLIGSDTLKVLKYIDLETN